MGYIQKRDINVGKIQIFQFKDTYMRLCCILWSIAYIFYISHINVTDCNIIIPAIKTIRFSVQAQLTRLIWPRFYRQKQKRKTSMSRKCRNHRS